jgi:CHASE2 domain-containing sensor protein
VSTAAAATLALVGYWPTQVQAGAPGVSAMLAGIGIALVGGWAGSLPTVAYLPRKPREHAIGILIGLATRFGVTLGLAVAAWLTGVFPKTPLLLWVGIGQLVILAVDVPGLVT